jgi:hypothetical protein
LVLQDELNLSEFPGLNAFSSAWILFNIDIDDFLRLPPVSRLDLFGPLFGHERMVRLLLFFLTLLIRLTIVSLFSPWTAVRQHAPGSTTTVAG